MDLSVLNSQNANMALKVTGVVLLFAFICVNCASSENGTKEEPRVTSSSGIFRGSKMTSRRGRDIFSFRGIRYAQPPIGELRFQPPQMIESYAQLVDAREDGPACPQPGEWIGETSEDCLRLNVYSLNISGNKSNHLAPVLVFFHAGGFYSVSGQSFLAGSHYLLDHDITLVTVNYRLGSLGFMSTGDKWSPGNNGLKDQVAALRWIKRNIASFGGDPNQVTISGYSAGSFSVTLHMLSPMTKGLFHRAIAMSASGVSQWQIPEHQHHLAEKQARILNCPDNSSEVIVECLKTKDSKDLANSFSQFHEFNTDPTLIWSPVSEPDLGQERYLTADPIKLVHEGKIHDVPLIIGITELEFAGLAFNLLQNETASQEMNNNWNEIAPISFQYERNTTRSIAASQEFREFYLGDSNLTYTNETAFALGRLYGDGLISFGAHRFANLMSEMLTNKVYYYKFNYTGSQSHNYYPGTKTPLGATHHDDLIYLFNGSLLFEPITLQSPDSHMVDKMTTMWTNFAIRGDPNPVGDQPALKGLNWPAMTPSERKYLQINDNFSIGSRMFEDRFRLWEKNFPLSDRY